jgi:protein involved in polysaccharide export with SLBB domain
MLNHPMMYRLLFVFTILLSAFNAHAQDVPGEMGYRLATGDAIYVRVYGEDDLTMRLTVPSDGAVRYAFVGDFQLAGKTIDQVEKEIMARLLGDYLVDPQVSVSIAEFRDFFIQGEVVRTGGIAWQPGLTVRTAITLAGGLRERASRSKWFLVPEGGGEENRRRVTEDDPVNPGDTLIVEQSFF